MHFLITVIHLLHRFIRHLNFRCYVPLLAFKRTTDFVPLTFPTVVRRLWTVDFSSLITEN